MNDWIKCGVAATAHHPLNVWAVRKSFWLIVVVGLLSVGASTAWADRAGRVISSSGEVTARPLGGKETNVKRGMHLDEGTAIRTGADSTARLLMKDKSILYVGPNSHVNLQTYSVQPAKRKVGIRLFLGKLWARVTKSFGGDKDFEVRTENAVAGVRGTFFAVGVDASGAVDVTVFEGEVEMRPTTGAAPVSLGAMKKAAVREDGTVKTGTVTPQEAATGAPPGAQQKLDDAKADERQNNAQEGAAGQGDSKGKGSPKGRSGTQGNEEGEGGDGSAAEDEAPPDNIAPVEIDVGAGRTRVRGKVEVRP